jgi:hypothetical protein
MERHHEPAGCFIVAGFRRYAAGSFERTKEPRSHLTPLTFSDEILELRGINAPPSAPSDALTTGTLHHAVTGGI